jgi:hypothetical protein
MILKNKRKSEEKTTIKEETCHSEFPQQQSTPNSKEKRTLSPVFAFNGKYECTVPNESPVQTVCPAKGFVPKAVVFGPP